MRPFDIEAVRADFPILGQRVYGRPLVYLDNAATAQTPLAVLAAMEEVYREYNSNVHRADYFLADRCTERYEQSRDVVRKFIGARHSEEVVFTSGATASLNIVARGLCSSVVGEGDNVVVSALEHHSNIVPWQMAGRELRVLEPDEGGGLDVERFERLIDSRTRVLAVTQCSNVLGVRPDLKKLIGVARSHGVLVVVDGCQGAVHGGVDVGELDCDFYAFSGHKLYGPTGIGMLWGRRELLEALPPLMGGGDMVAPGGVTFEGARYADIPFRHEAGTANYVGAIGLAAAIEWLGQWDGVEGYEQMLLRRAVDGLSQIDGLTIYGSMDNRAPILAFSVDGVHCGDLGAILDKQGVAIRTGMHCAQPLVERLGLRSVCRASFGIYNTEAEAAFLAEAVGKGVKMLCR